MAKEKFIKSDYNASALLKKCNPEERRVIGYNEVDGEEVVTIGIKRDDLNTTPQTELEKVLTLGANGVRTRYLSGKGLNY